MGCYLLVSEPLEMLNPPPEAITPSPPGPGSCSLDGRVLATLPPPELASDATEAFLIGFTCDLESKISRYEA